MGVSGKYRLQTLGYRAEEKRSPSSKLAETLRPEEK
jgi:hypothetical protein